MCSNDSLEEIIVEGEVVKDVVDVTDVADLPTIKYRGWLKYKDITYMVTWSFDNIGDVDVDYLPFEDSNCVSEIIELS